MAMQTQEGIICFTEAVDVAPDAAFVSTLFRSVSFGWGLAVNTVAKNLGLISKRWRVHVLGNELCCHNLELVLRGNLQ